MTTKRLRGMSTSKPLRLCCSAFRTLINLVKPTRLLWFQVNLSGIVLCMIQHSL